MGTREVQCSRLVVCRCEVEWSGEDSLVMTQVFPQHQYSTSHQTQTSLYRALTVGKKGINLTESVVTKTKSDDGNAVTAWRECVVCTFRMLQTLATTQHSRQTIHKQDHVGQKMTDARSGQMLQHI